MSGDTCDGECGPYSTVTFLVHMFFYYYWKFIFVLPSPIVGGGFLVTSLRQLFTVNIHSLCFEISFSKKMVGQKNHSADLNSHSMYRKTTKKPMKEG